MMLFHEVYGSYYRILGELLKLSVAGTLKQEDIYRVIRKEGFEETILTLPEKLKDQSWPLIRSDGTTPLKYAPRMPLTTLEKRWMKTLLSDPRIRLFDLTEAGLEDVEPLYPVDAVVYFDRYNDGDPFEDPAYIQRFQTILQAIRENRWLEVDYMTYGGKRSLWRCIPDKLEYSAKDDKFRLLTCNEKAPRILNLGRITDCRLGQPCRGDERLPSELRKHTLELELVNRRDALERCMIHFSDLEKETVHLEADRYLVKMRYAQKDEAELLIRLLSFGPFVKVLSPDHVKKELIRRIRRQMDLAKIQPNSESDPAE